MDDVRQLESGLNGVAAKSSLLGVPIDLAAGGERRQAHRQPAPENHPGGHQEARLQILQRLPRGSRLALAQAEPRAAAADGDLPRTPLHRCSPCRPSARASTATTPRRCTPFNASKRASSRTAPLRQQVDFFRQKLESGKFMSGGYSEFQASRSSRLARAAPSPSQTSRQIF
ncbi:MAG: hypothetical protein MZV70_18785 [Desulfobacterales bacterium]|nr:hypothetical protein [Desulfobacterales bacterium]